MSNEEEPVKLLDTIYHVLFDYKFHAYLNYFLDLLECYQELSKIS